MAFPNSEAARPSTTDLRFGEVLRRLDFQDKVLDKLANGSADVIATINRIEKVQIENIEQLRAMARANQTAIETLDKKIDHKDHTSIDRDKVQVSMIRDETSAREAAMDKQQKDHDIDIASLKDDIKAVDGKVETLKDKVTDAITLTRVILALSAITAIAIAGAVFSGHISVVLHP